MRQIDIDTFKADRDAGKVTALFDVRSAGEFSTGHVPGAVLVELQTLPARMDAFEAHRDETIYVICQSGGRSANACMYLEAHGFDVINVGGGTGAWIRAGYEVER